MDVSAYLDTTKIFWYPKLLTLMHVYIDKIAPQKSDYEPKYVLFQVAL